MSYKKLPLSACSKFMVFIKGHDAPKYCHDHFGSAYKEAHRLAKLFPNEQVYAVKVKSILEYNEVGAETFGSVASGEINHEH